MEVSGELCLSSSSINSSSVVQVSSRTCPKSIQISYSSRTMFNGDSLASHSSQHVERCSSSVPHHKASHHGYFSRLVAQGSVIAAFSPVAAQRHVQTSILFLSLSGSGGDYLSIYNKSLSAVLEGMGRLVCSGGCTRQCHFCP